MLPSLTHNERRILDLLRREGPMSRTGLAKAMDLTTPSLSRLTQSLANHQLVRELHKLRDGLRGKPAQLITLNPDGAYAVGFAVQAEHLSACVVDLEGKVRSSRSLNLAEIEPRLVARWAAKLLEQLLEETGISRKRVLGAGISMPGVAIGAYGAGLTPSGTLHLPDEYAAWKGLDIPRHFEDALGMPSWLENSAKAATLADMYFGEANRFDSFAVIHIAYGFGGGLVLDRRPYRGSCGRAAEFGGLFPYTGIRPSGRDLLMFLAQHMDAPPQHVRELAHAEIPEAILNAWFERIGPGLVDLARHLSVMLDLQAIVLNGLLPPPMLARMAQLVREQLPRLIPPELGVPELLVSRLAKSGLELGAACLPLHHRTSTS